MVPASAAAQQGFATATDLADYLVRRGMAFRDAHEAVGRAVRRAAERGCELEALPLDELRSFAPGIDVGADVLAAITLEGSVAARNHVGGTAPAQVARQIAFWRERLSSPLPPAGEGENGSNSLREFESDQLPPTVRLSMSTDPVFLPPRLSVSAPTATMPPKMPRRLPAMVISSTGCAITPFSTQKPLAPRE